MSTECQPAEETCDKVDNDCDGKIDESLVRKCGTDVGACEFGNVACIDGTWEDDSKCQGGIGPTEEACDEALVDEDCDDQKNEGCDCVEGTTMECGNSNPPCKKGVQTCINGKLSATCEGEVKGSEETCDGQDNDCDAKTDEGESFLCTDGQICGGSLKCIECESAADCRNRPAATCKSWTCNTATHKCQQENADNGSSCAGSRFCGDGSCVECVIDDNCDDGFECVRNQCEKVARCGDRVRDSGEDCDDGNTDESDSCTSECKTARCGDGRWHNKVGDSNLEECDLGAPSDLSDNREWETWSCTTSCVRRYVYTPCVQVDDCGIASYLCASNGASGGVKNGCMRTCTGQFGTFPACDAIPGEAESGICVSGALCYLKCESNRDCPPGITCIDNAAAMQRICQHVP